MSCAVPVQPGQVRDQQHSGLDLILEIRGTPAREGPFEVICERWWLQLTKQRHSISLLWFKRVFLHTRSLSISLCLCLFQKQPQYILLSSPFRLKD